MSTKVAPWLQGLDEAWEAPASIPASAHISSASHDATSLRRNSSRVPRRSLSGLPSSMGSQKTASDATTQIKRSPLAALVNTNANTMRKQQGTMRQTGTRSVSEASDGSLLQCGTVQQRSKSASPAKKQETLEWKKRLVGGQVGYGDQTDLFGPSGLENIFARSKGQENEEPRPKNRMRWMPRTGAAMPSSPPPWPSSEGPQADESYDEASAQDLEDSRLNEDSFDEQEWDGSLRSNPFDLENIDELVEKSSPETQRMHDAKDGVGNRTTSGQTELEQEDFSPVYISKHTSMNGQVNYAALDSHLVKQFKSMTVDLRHPSRELRETNLPDEQQRDDAVDQSAYTDGPGSEALPGAPDLSLSENLPTGTPPVASLGRNVEFKRGGYSAYGSFKQRPLSPSPSNVEDSAAPEESELLSPTAYRNRLPPLAPTPPPASNPPLRPTTPNPPKARSSGSPLKLFGPHDTFTSNRLLRRLSQLDPDGNLIKEEQPADQHEPISALTEKRKESAADSRNSFGSGQLDSCGFDAEITVTGASDSDQDGSDRSPGSEIPVPGGRDPLDFTFEPSPDFKDTHKLKRRLSRHSVANSKGSTIEVVNGASVPLQATVEDASELDAYFQRAEQVKSFEGTKRPPTSPFKNPTPKRRRTLHASELEDGLAALNDSYHDQLQKTLSSRKRNDARPDHVQSVADADTLASRKILRPRNPTPSQRRRDQIEAELRKAAEEFAAQEPDKLEAVMEHIESSMAGSDGPPTLQQQAAVLAAEVANFTMRVHKPSGDHGERKPSITTQDFMNEAVMVMQLIRSKARPQSGLSSVEESDAEALDESLRPASSVHEAEGSLRISRPPSRDGRVSGWRSAMIPQTDARVVSHLRRFQERDDTEFIADSIASLHVEDEESLNDNVVVVDEHSNIRIIVPPAHGRHGLEAEDDSRPASQRSQDSILDTQQSAGTSSGRTIGTSSTRKSENVGTLAPNAVAHLIGEQVGGMSFDKETQRWVRAKSPEKQQKERRSFLGPPSIVTSDDDPFREISDLPVDEHVELRRISSSGNTIRETISATTVTVDFESQPAQTEEDHTISTETAVPHPVIGDRSHMHRGIRHMHSSSVPSVPSRYSAFASSQQQEKVETRATSYSDEDLARMTEMGKARHQPLAYAAAQATLALRGESARVQEEVEEFTEVTFPLPGGRDVPLDISEPTVEYAYPGPAYHTAATSKTGLRDDTVLDVAQPEIRAIASPKLRQSLPRPVNVQPTEWREVPREMSSRRKTLTTAFGVEARQQSDISLVTALPGDRLLSLSLSVSRPVTTRHQSKRLEELHSSPTKGNLNSTLLSDLPDFTVHEADEQGPTERALAQRLAKHAAVEVNDRYALAVKDLVRTLTDIHEDEPYWEDVRSLDLCERSLTSLYGLEDFCTHVQRLDVSENSLTQLYGAPATTRVLDARLNQLSGLTAWGHLGNLQYLDVSGNQLDSLKGLSGLVHLRELRADGNRIATLDGIQELDGLLKLRLRGNQIQQVDLVDFQLLHLEDLDLTDNDVCAVRGLECLPALRHLRLDGNLLQSGLQVQHEMPCLETLSIQRCDLESLDVSHLPNLRFLHADDNKLAGISGISSLNYLDCLSLRRQRLPAGTHISVFDHPLEARTLRLSGNTFPTLQLSTTYLNLQHLELASIGLQSLPNDFGLRMPNLRTLNLNFNALRDVRPLLNIHQLRELSVCGNRLDRLRKSVATLAKLSGLRALDLRDNPVTQGFYLPASLTSTMSETSVVRRSLRRQDSISTTDADSEALEHAKYCLPSGDAEQDSLHQGRLDEETRLRRRVYELLLAHSCPALDRLDGLGLDRRAVCVRDRVWERLVEMGVVRKSGGPE